MEKHSCLIQKVYEWSKLVIGCTVSLLSAFHFCLKQQIKLLKLYYILSIKLDCHPKFSWGLVIVKERNVNKGYS